MKDVLSYFAFMNMYWYQKWGKVAALLFLLAYPPLFPIFLPCFRSYFDAVVCMFLG